MGIFDVANKIKKTKETLQENGVKELTKQAINNKKENLAQSIETKKENAELKATKKEEFKKKQSEYKSIFRVTQRYGDVEIDDENKLLKIHNCTSNIKSSSKAIRVTKGILALGTYGASLALEFAFKPSDTIFSYDEILDYELFENNLSVESGGLGRAIVGGVAGNKLGVGKGLGAFIGGSTAKRKTRKAVDSMALSINTNNFFFPNIMITYISKEKKTSGRGYTAAYSKAKEAMSCLNIIFKQLENDNTSITSISNEYDPYEEIKKAKELLDMGIITQEEYDIKKKELLNL